MSHFSLYFNQKSLESRYLYEPQYFCAKQYHDSASCNEIYVWPGFLDICINEESKDILKTYQLTSCSDLFRYKNYIRSHDGMLPPDIRFESLYLVNVGYCRYTEGRVLQDVEYIKGSEEEQISQIVESVNLLIQDIPEEMLIRTFCS